MRSKEDYKIIINKGRTKETAFFFLSLTESVVLFVLAGIIFKISQLIFSDIFALIIAIGATVSVSFLFYEIPSEHISVSDFIKLAYNYYFKKDRQFFYYRDLEKLKNNDKEDEDEERNKVKEKRYKAKRK